MTTTVAKIRASQWQLVLHARLAKGGSLYHYRGLDYPRLVVGCSKISRQSPTETRYAIDGEIVPTIEAAVEALNRPEGEAQAEKVETA